MSLMDELQDDDGDSDSPPPAKGGLLNELTGESRDDEIDAAEEETKQAAQDQLGQAALVAIKGNDAKGLYRALADILANEG